jgi:hypothetical protein
VELVGKVGDDAQGDAVAVELQRAGVGHAALLRDPSSATPPGVSAAPPRLEEGDLELALRYLVDVRVIVSTEPLTDGSERLLGEAADYAGAHRIVLTEGAGGARAAGGVPQDGAPGRGDAVTELRARRGDRHAFAALVGRYAALLDAGEPARSAFARAVEDVGWEPAGGA